MSILICILITFSIFHFSISLVSPILSGYANISNEIYDISYIINVINFIFTSICYFIKYYIIKFCIDNSENIIPLDLIIYGLLLTFLGLISIILLIICLSSDIYTITIIFTSISFMINTILYFLFIPYIKIYKEFIDEREKYEQIL